MPYWYLILLAAVQGITEFLPISSSGHLILVPALTGLEDQGTFLDVAVHVGTLGAVLAYFRADSMAALRGLGGLVLRRRGPEERLALALVIATIPVILAGLVLELTLGTEWLRSVKVIAFTTLGYGALLWLVDRRGPKGLSLPDWGPARALVLGLWQALALLPGTSRSGICMTGARAMGFDRPEAARIATLMSIPTILASGSFLAVEVWGEGDAQVWRDAGLAAAFSFVAALIALALMMRFLRRHSFGVFVGYRMALGAFLLIWAYAL